MNFLGGTEILSTGEFFYFVIEYDLCQEILWEPTGILVTRILTLLWATNLVSVKAGGGQRWSMAGSRSLDLANKVFISRIF